MGAAERIQQEVDQERKNGAIVFLPSAIVPESFYRPVIEKVCLTKEDVYESQKKFRIKFEGLLKLANAAGIEWSPVDSGRTDNGSDKLYVSFRAVGLIRKADGKLYPTAASYDLDLELVKEELEDQYQQKVATWENKSAEEKVDYINYCVKRDWFHKRHHKATLAESGAKARVIRSILGLQSQYSNIKDLTGRPFVLVRFVLDHQNQDIRKAMLSAAEKNMAAIYGGAVPAALPRFESVVDDDVIDATHHVIEADSAEDMPGIDQNPYGDVPFEPVQDNQLVDFENSDSDIQIRTLTDLCSQKKYDLSDYLKRAKLKGLQQLVPAKRIELFQYLIGSK